MLVQGEQAMAEARRPDRVDAVCSARLLDRVARLREDVFRVVFAGVVAGEPGPASSAVSSNRQARTEDVPTSRARTRVTSRTLTAVAVLIASNLRKEFSGDPLFDGVSFKVERRDRVALAGPNGAGKTTLLRAIVGETNLQGGDIVFQKGTRVALHDQRPPLERRLTLRDYVLSGARDLIALEEELRRLEQAMAAEITTTPRFAGTARRRRGSNMPAATTGASAQPPSYAGSASRTSSSIASSTPSRAAS